MKIRIRYRDNTGEVTAGAVQAFRIGTTLLAMTAVALLSALITMRLAIHTGEVETPNLSGLTVEEAAAATQAHRLNLTVENRFYSTTVPAGRVLSQSPSAGTTVRKGWHMRITESIGPQRVAIPDTVGMNEREAGMAIRRVSLDIGAMAHLPSPGASDMVLAQTPPANAEGVDKPEVSLLLTQPESAAPKAFVMPNLVGLSYSAASARMREMDLRVYAIVPQPAAPAADSGAPAPVAMIPAGVVLSQTPAAGMRVSSTETPKVRMSAAAVASSAAPAGTPAPQTAPKTMPAKPSAPLAPPSPAKSLTPARPSAAPVFRQTPAAR